MNPFHFPENFALGVSTAATQIEGGDTNNNWYDWAEAGHIKDGTSPVVADMHYEKYKEDVDVMSIMGIQHYRMGVEWSRIEPEEGVFDEEALEHYRTEILLMRQKGIRPLLTIHHFSNPSWFEKKGAFTNKNAVKIFMEYATYLVKGLGDIVSEYITINEPNVYAMNGYFGGGFPPGKNNFFQYAKVLTTMTDCHIRCYKMIHQVREEMGYSDTKVSFAMHLRVFEPADKNKWFHRFCANFAKKCFQDSVTEAMAFGKLAFPINSIPGVKKGCYIDFWGINYYSRSTISGLQDGVRENAPINDLGWEIYPQGIVDCFKEYYYQLPKDVYITENGTCDNNDAFRSRYLYEHIKALVESELPIKRYYHWCFTDNFEWLEGQSARFGLVYVDYESQKRTLKNSGRFYSEMIANQGVTEDMIRKYCRQIYLKHSQDTASSNHRND